MRSNLVYGTTTAIAAAMMFAGLGGLATPALAAKVDKKADAGKPAGPKLSKPVQAVLSDAQKLQTAKDYPGALAKIREAEALPNRTDDDNYMINAIKLNDAIGMRAATSVAAVPTGTLNPADALLEEALNGMLASSRVTAEDRPKFLRNLSVLALQRNDYIAATKRSEELVALSPNDPEALIGLAELYRKQKQPTKALDTLNRAIAAQTAAGKVADESWYATAVRIAYDNKLSAPTQTAALALVTAYPKPSNWRDALVILRDSAKLDDQGNLDVMRLMATAGALNGERDYVEYAETAAVRGLPGEAKAALAQGRAAGALNSNRATTADLGKMVDGKVAGDRASLPGLDRDARKAATGKAAAGTADAYYGYGEYAKAADLYRFALTKGGVDSDTVYLRLGASLARSGDKAGAAAALANVKSGPRAQLAQYWMLWLSKQA